MELDGETNGSTVTYAQAAPTGGKELDLVFILDCTGSMGSYIASATKNIELIVNNILESEHQTLDLRMGLVHYRDHPPQDNSYVTGLQQMTSSVPEIQATLKGLFASGGGDGPEAVTAAMKSALSDLHWRQNSSKIVLLIADAPPHGIGEYGDGFASGSPDGEDPLQLAREMASRGITLFCVACEPALSGYQFATDFFRAISKITGGLLIPLATADLLAHVVVGSVLEMMNLESLINEVGPAVGERVHGGSDVDEVARELHEKLLLRQEETKSLSFERIHRDSEEARYNVEVFCNSMTLADVKETGLKKVLGSRFTEKYLQSRYTTSSYSRTTAYPSLPVVPPRSATSTGSLLASTTSPSPPASPPRKVVSEFKAFSAASTSMADTPLSEEVDDITSSIEMKFGAISLDQAKRITQASAWRSAPPRA